MNFRFPIPPASLNTAAMFTETATLFPLLFTTGLAAGFVDAIAGGGGLITLPVLLSTGMSPQLALGTNKLQASFGSGGATWHFARAGLINIREWRMGIFCTFIGAAAGAFAVQQIDANILRRIIPFLLAAIIAYNLWRPQLGEADIHPRLTKPVFATAFGLGLGFYDGFLGPGTGSFWAMAFMLGLGFNLTKATAHTKIMNFTSNIAALLLFVFGGHVLYLSGLIMGAGQLIGARLGAGMAIRRGTAFIRPIFLTMVAAVTLKLLYDGYFKVH